MAAVSGLLIPILRKFIREEASRRVRKGMENAHVAIVAGMQSKGMDPLQVPVNLCVRDAMFRLWRSVIPSGDISDLVRDCTELMVVPAVLKSLPVDASLSSLVHATREEVLKQAAASLEAVT